MRVLVFLVSVSLLMQAAIAGPRPNDAGFLIRDMTDNCILKVDEVVCSDWDYTRSNRRGGFRDASIIGSSFSGTRVCVVDADGIWCPGKYEPPTPNVVGRVRELAVAEAHACLIDEAGVQCWGEGFEHLNIPTGLHYPTDLVATDTQTCVIDDGTVKCWGDRTTRTPRDLVNPKSLAISETNICVLDQGDVRCWDTEWPISSDLARSVNNVPTLDSGVHDVAVGYGVACALKETSVTCWGNNAPPAHVLPANLRHPRLLTSGCVVDDDGPFCWGVGSIFARPVEDLRAPGLLAVSKDYGCANTLDGIRCWGLAPARLEEVSGTGIKEICATEIGMCTIGVNGLKCSGFRVDNAAGWIVPKLNNPHHLHGMAGGFCAFEIERPVCWGQARPISFPPPAMVTKLKALTSIDTYNGAQTQAFAISGDRIVGWGDYAVDLDPVMSNIRELALNESSRLCALGDDAIQCWERDRSSESGLKFVKKISIRSAHSLTASYDLLCVIQSSVPFCWDSKFSPVHLLPSVGGVTRLAGNSWHLCAETTNGIRCWANGNGTPMRESSPIPWYEHADETLSRSRTQRN